MIRDCGYVCDATKYCFRDNKLTIHEGTIAKTPYGGKMFSFTKNGSMMQTNFKITFGVITNGTTLYLSERDDELAKELFLEHLENRVAKLQNDLNKSLESIKLIQEWS